MKHRTFRNPTVLGEMIALRLEGWALRDLAFKYGCDKQAIRRACLKRNIPARIELLPTPVIVLVRPITDWNGERINTGKSYREYLEDERRRTSPLERAKQRHKMKIYANAQR